MKLLKLTIPESVGHYEGRDLVVRILKTEGSERAQLDRCEKTIQRQLQFQRPVMLFADGRASYDFSWEWL